MPVIIVGADTTLGDQIVEALLSEAAEVRVFITNPATAPDLKRRGAKVAIGDVSDSSHIGSAALHTFCAVLIAEAATDSRERSFANHADEVISGWAAGLADAGTTRALLVDGEGLDTTPLRAVMSEFVVISTYDRSWATIVADVVQLEGTASLTQPDN